jgi:hypothetical protein
MGAYEPSREPSCPAGSLSSLVGRYDNPIPTRFLAPLGCYKIPALHSKWNVLYCALIKQKIKFSSYLSKFRMEQLRIFSYI